MTLSAASRAGMLGTLAACALLGTACSTPGTGARVTQRDSAGVQIIESTDPAWDGTAGWQIPPAPLLEIGTPGATPAPEFQRIDGARRLRDGRIVVADGGAGTIRLFGPDGSPLWSVGRAGDGPGEYRMIESIGVGPGDSIWVFDFGLRRFTILAFGGETVRTVPLGGELSAVGAVGRLPDGRFVVREFWSGAAGGGALRPGLRRDPAAVALLDSDGTLTDTIALVRGREVFLRSENGRAVMSAPLFARTAVAAVRDGQVIAGDQERFELQVHGATGTLERSIRILGLDLSIAASDVDRLIEEEAARRPESERAGLRRDLESMDVPPTRPAFGDVLVDDDGNLWAAEYVRWPRLPRAWTVVDPEGAWLGTIPMPGRFRPLHIGGDWVLGVWRDEMDVERVRLYRLDRSPRGDDRRGSEPRP